MATDIISIIQHYQRSIDRCQDDEERILHCIGKLYTLPVKVEHLQKTGVGKTVNSLRKFNGEIGVAAKTLVTKWKAMVAAEEEEVLNTNQNESPADDNHNSNSDKETSDEDQYDHNRNNATQTKADVERQSPKETEKHRNKEDRENSRNDNKPYGKDERHHNHNVSVKVIEKSSKHHKSNSSEQHHSDKKERRESEKHHKNHHRSDDKNENKDKRHKDRHKHYEKERSNDKRKEEKLEQNHKDVDKKSSVSTNSSHHRRSSSDKKEEKKANHENNKHDTTKHNSDHHRVREKESKNREHERHGDSKESNKHSKKSTKDEKISSEKCTSKSKEHSSATTSNSSSNNIKSTSSTTVSTSHKSSSERKRGHDSNENPDDVQSPKTKKLKVKTVEKKMNSIENGAEDDEDNANGFDSSMGANFGDILGMLNMPTKKSKKALNNIKSTNNTINHSSSTNLSNKNSSNSGTGMKDQPSTSQNNSKLNGMKPSTSTASMRNLEIKPDLLSSTAKLAPLDPSIVFELPTISNNYKPMPLNQTVMDCVFNSGSSSASSSSKAPVRTLTDAEALSHGISSKTMRTKIYSGHKTGQILQVPTLFDLCIRILQKNIDALEYTGGVPFEVLRAVLERATPQQLLTFEDYNPYVMDDSDILWKQHVQRHYRSQKRLEMETWREMFLRCQDDQERKLNVLAESIKQSQKIIAAPVRKTQLAFVDSMVKPPRSVIRKQEQFGTKSKLVATPAARVAALSNVTPNAAKLGDARLRVAAGMRDAAQVSHSTSAIRPKKAPLMVKTLQFIRGRNKR